MSKKKTRSLQTVGAIGEFGLVEWIKRHTPKLKGVRRGIGDDTAVLRDANGQNQLFTIDTIVENIDFRTCEATPEEIGWKALAVNLSDIAAMGGVPTVAVVSLTLPRNTSLRFVKRFYAGMRRAAEKYHVALVGGDLSRGPKVSCSVALLGQTLKHRTIYRTGARVGDVIGVTGHLGGSILGKHLRFLPRIKEGQFLARAGAHTMIDISDGLIQDLGHLLERKGLGFELDKATVPVSGAACKLARGNPHEAIRHALFDGEDFELLFTMKPAAFRRLTPRWKKQFSIPLTAIGYVRRASKSSRTINGTNGFQHF